MSLNLRRNRTSAALGLLSATLLVAVATAQVPSPPETPARGATAIPSEVVEEWTIQAREEVARLEAQLKTRKMAARMADADLEIAQTRHNYTENMLAKGLTSKAILRSNEIARLEAEMRVTMREADQKETEIRLAQAKRRSQRLDRGQANLLLDGAESGAQLLGRVLDLESLINRLRQENESIEVRMRTLEKGSR